MTSIFYRKDAGLFEVLWNRWNWMKTKRWCY